MISIGVDQSTTKTGLCCVSFDLVGKHVVNKRITVETPDYISMREAILEFIGKNWLWTPKAVIAEDGFPGCNVSTTVTAAWVEAIVLEHKIGELFAKVSASEWRKKVWPDAGNVKCDACYGTGKDVALAAAEAIGASITSQRGGKCSKCYGKGFTTKKMLSADWKAHGIAEAEKDGIVKPTDHVGDARGLALYGKILWLEGMNDGSENTE